MLIKLISTVLVILIVLLVGSPAQAQQSLSLSVGYFAVRGEDTRVADDVLIENLSLFTFELKDFNSGAIGGEWLVGFGDYFETGVGLAYYKRAVPSVYNDFVNFDGTEIAQDLSLRVVPFTMSLRVFPFGRHVGIQPYLGGGLGVFNWRYSEIGEFVDFTDMAIFSDKFVADGTDMGSIILGGVRFPVGDDFFLGGELRHQNVSGTVGIDQGFLNEEIDLGGFSTQLTFQVDF